MNHILSTNDNVSNSDVTILILWQTINIISINVAMNILILIDIDMQNVNAQYTPPTPTRLNCRVESRRRCVLNSQLAHDDC